MFTGGLERVKGALHQQLSFATNHSAESPERDMDGARGEGEGKGIETNFHR